MQVDKSIFPAEIQKIIRDMPVESNDVGRSGALVAFIGDELVLKRAEKGKLQNACLMQSFFHKNALAPKVVYYSSDDYDYLISQKAEGRSAIDPEHMRNPVHLAHALGEFLLKIHSLDVSACPVQNVMEVQLQEFDRAALRNAGLYEHISGYLKLQTMDEVKKIVNDARPHFRSDTVLHGDYCLPNIMLSDFRGRHVIDVGEGGAGDKSFDLFWGLWSLSYNLKTDIYRKEFLSTYGKNRIDEGMIYAAGCLCALI